MCDSWLQVAWSSGEQPLLLAAQLLESCTLKIAPLIQGVDGSEFKTILTHPVLELPQEPTCKTGGCSFSQRQFCTCSKWSGHLRLTRCLPFALFVLQVSFARAHKGGVERNALEVLRTDQRKLRSCAKKVKELHPGAGAGRVELCREGAGGREPDTR